MFNSNWQALLFFVSFQSSVFKWFILVVILCNCVLISLETTELGNTAAHFFKAMDDIFLAVFVMEFAVKIYVQRVQYWKSYCNLLDFAVLVTFSSQIVLELVYYQHQEILVVSTVMKGMHYYGTIVLENLLGLTEYFQYRMS